MQGVVNEEIFQVFHNKTRQTENIESIPQQLKEYFESQIVAPSESYFHETLEQHLSGLKPNASTFEEVRALLLSSDCELEQAARGAADGASLTMMSPFSGVHLQRCREVVAAA